MPRLENTVVAIAQLAQQSGHILTDFHFDNCTIVGPAVLVPIRDVHFESCMFEGDPEAILWEFPPDREQIIGGIGLVDCTFVNCRLSAIGIAGPPEVVKDFRAQLEAGAGARITAS